MSPITTHVLDISRGCPAQGIAVMLDRQLADLTWTALGRGATNAEGRLATLLPAGPLTPGIYRLRFATGDYFAALHLKAFYPEVQVVFKIEDAAGHYHLPLLLSPYGYSTYRGS